MKILRWDASARVVNRANASSSIAARASELSSDAHPTFWPLPTVFPTVSVSSSCMVCPRARAALSSAAPTPTASDISAVPSRAPRIDPTSERSVSRAPRVRPPRRSRASSSTEPNLRPPASRARLDCAQLETHLRRPQFVVPHNNTPPRTNEQSICPLRRSRSLRVAPAHEGCARTLKRGFARVASRVDRPRSFEQLVESRLIGRRVERRR